VQFREGASNWVDTPFLQATTFEYERQTPNAEREAPGETGGLAVNPGCLLGRERSASFSLCSLGLGGELLNELAGHQELHGLT
jgi:hypothetical protein